MGNADLTYFILLILLPYRLFPFNLTYWSLYFLFFIYTIFQEGDTIGMKAILPCGPLNTKHIKKTIYIYTNSKYKQCTLFKLSLLFKIRNNQYVLLPVLYTMEQGM